MTDNIEATTPQVVQPGNKTKPTPYQPRSQWTPVFADSKGLLPVGWQCLCGYGAAIENCSCPQCGRFVRATMNGKLDGSPRCITGRQGRDYKRLAKRERH